MRIDLFDDASNLTYVAAYLVKDLLWLRILSIVGSLIVLPYFLLQPEAGLCESCRQYLLMSRASDLR
jgi:hypothetical protein